MSRAYCVLGGLVDLKEKSAEWVQGARMALIDRYGSRENGQHAPRNRAPGEGRPYFIGGAALGKGSCLLHTQWDK